MADFTEEEIPDIADMMENDFPDSNLLKRLRSKRGFEFLSTAAAYDEVTNFPTYLEEIDKDLVEINEGKIERYKCLSDIREVFKENPNCALAIFVDLSRLRRKSALLRSDIFSIFSVTRDIYGSCLDAQIALAHKILQRDKTESTKQLSTAELKYAVAMDSKLSKYTLSLNHVLYNSYLTQIGCVKGVMMATIEYFEEYLEILEILGPNRTRFKELDEEILENFEKVFCCGFNSLIDAVHPDQVKLKTMSPQMKELRSRAKNISESISAIKFEQEQLRQAFDRIMAYAKKASRPKNDNLQELRQDFEKAVRHICYSKDSLTLRKDLRMIKYARDCQYEISKTTVDSNEKVEVRFDAAAPILLAHMPFAIHDYVDNFKYSLLAGLHLEPLDSKMKFLPMFSDFTAEFTLFVRDLTSFEPTIERQSFFEEINSYLQGHDLKTPSGLIKKETRMDELEVFYCNTMHSLNVIFNTLSEYTKELKKLLHDEIVTLSTHSINTSIFERYIMSRQILVNAYRGIQHAIRLHLRNLGCNSLFNNKRTEESLYEFSIFCRLDSIMEKYVFLTSGPSFEHFSERIEEMDDIFDRSSELNPDIDSIEALNLLKPEERERIEKLRDEVAEEINQFDEWYENRNIENFFNPFDFVVYDRKTLTSDEAFAQAKEFFFQVFDRASSEEMGKLLNLRNFSKNSIVTSLNSSVRKNQNLLQRIVTNVDDLMLVQKKNYHKDPKKITEAYQRDRLVEATYFAGDFKQNYAKYAKESFKAVGDFCVCGATLYSRLAETSEEEFNALRTLLFTIRQARELSRNSKGVLKRLCQDSDEKYASICRDAIKSYDRYELQDMPELDSLERSIEDMLSLSKRKCKMTETQAAVASDVFICELQNLCYWHQEIEEKEKKGGKTK